MSSKIIVDLSTKHPNTYMHIYTGMCINTCVNIYRHAHKVEHDLIILILLFLDFLLQQCDMEFFGIRQKAKSQEHFFPLHRSKDWDSKY